MKLVEIAHNYDWREAYHVTNVDISNTQYLEASTTRTAMNKGDAIMIQVLPEYASSVFFSLGWPRATEWKEMGGAKHILRYQTEYLLDNFNCILLKDDHLERRFAFLEYFITDSSERDEYLTLIEPYRAKNSGPTYSAHPKLKGWTELAKQATPDQYKPFVENELIIRGSDKIKKYFSTIKPYFEELLVQGRIPISESEKVQ